jgi:D-ribose pyranose/furanose isomerase RbsD
MNSESKPSVEQVYDLLSKEMYEQAVECGKEISDDAKEVMTELETKYGRAWAYRYGVFYYYYFKVGSEMMIG